MGFRDISQQITVAAVIKPTTNLSWLFTGYARPLHCFWDLGSPKYNPRIQHMFCSIHVCSTPNLPTSIIPTNIA